MMKFKMSRLLALFLTLLAMSAMFAVPTAAASSSGLRSPTTWVDYADKTAPYDDAGDLAKRLSSLAGSSKMRQTDGRMQYTIVITGDGDNYVGGKLIPSTDDGVPSNIDGYYSKLDVTYGDFTVGVYINNEADDKALGRVTSTIAQGLLSSSGVTPNTTAAMELLSGVMPIINTGLGLIVTIISIGMTVFSALDIIYLAFPTFRDKIDEQVEGGGRGTKTKKDGSKASLWVSDDARNAIKETQENQRQPWGNYFKRRVIAYIFLAVILFILLTGNIFAITTLVTDVLSGLFSALGIG